MIQIKNLVLYGKNGKVRSLDFKIGTLNLICGSSKTGKSVISDIIDYCLGAQDCNVAEGVVRENVSWYGLNLYIKDDLNFFVARKAPEKGKKSDSNCYFGMSGIPEKNKLSENISVSNLTVMLNRIIGLSHMEIWGKEHQYYASIRQAILFCLQNQDEIASKNILFHKQSNIYIAKLIKETILFFLGVMEEKELEVRKRLQKLNKEREVLELTIEARKTISKNISEDGAKLFGEFVGAGFIGKDLELSTEEQLCSLFVNKDNILKNKKTGTGDERLSYLRKEIKNCYDKMSKLSDNLAQVEEFTAEMINFTEEVGYQKKRLKAIGLYEKFYKKDDIGFPVEIKNKIEESLKEIDAALIGKDHTNPRFNEYVREQKDKYKELLEQANIFRSEIDGIYNSSRRDETLTVDEFNRGILFGKLESWVDNYRKTIDTTESNNALSELKKKIDILQNTIDEQNIELKQTDALREIQNDMNLWAQKLDLESKDYEHLLNLNKLTVFATNSKRTMSLKQMGSGSNWLGIHLITTFALQKFFVKNNRPVPRFLFLDQPSQVYFSSDGEYEDIDNKEVEKIYNFIIDRVKELNGQFQVIAVDHANVGESVKEYICEDWRINDSALIPKSWYDESE